MKALNESKDPVATFGSLDEEKALRSNKLKLTDIQRDVE
jgi:hypothetical protein